MEKIVKSFFESLSIFRRKASNSSSVNFNLVFLSLDDSTIKQNLIKLLSKLKSKGKKITGYGAPAKGNTLLNYCKIGPETLDYLSDTTPYKQGKLSPGMHIPIVSPEVFYEDPPDYALMLPWNYKTEILIKEKEYINNGGKFIVPIPTPKIVP